MEKILDGWFARTSLGRAAVLSSIPIKTLIQSMRGNIALPTFWRQSLVALRELPLTLTNLSTDGALSQPIWDNLHFPLRESPSSTETDGRAYRGRCCTTYIPTERERYPSPRKTMKNISTQRTIPAIFRTKNKQRTLP
jgi:hypothetical protein